LPGAAARGTVQPTGVPDAQPIPVIAIPKTSREEPVSRSPAPSPFTAARGRRFRAVRGRRRRPVLRPGFLAVRRRRSPAAGRARAPRAAVFLFAAAAGALFTPVGTEAQGLTADEVIRVDSVFEDWSDPAGPGAAVAITRNGRIVYSQGYGSAQLEYRIPVAPTTIFHVASVSKQFTTFAVALLARDGLLSWDDEVHRHLPELPDLGRPVTLRHLANHTSGVRDQWELLIQAGWRIDDVITRDQIMALMARQRELNFEPGSEYLYSNMGYSLLAEVVERVSGMSFGAFLHERVFLPLSMHRTHVHSDHTMVVPGRAYSYAPGANGEWRNAVLSYANQGATSLFTTVEDLARWIAEMEEPVVGDPDLWAEMVEPAPLNSGDTAPYGLGISVGTYRGLATRGHGGADAGFRTNLLHFPQERVGVVVFGNAASFNAAGMARGVADVILAGRLEEENGEEDPHRGPVTVAAETLEELVGVYRVPDGMLVSVVLRQGRLEAEVGPEDRFLLVPTSDSTFNVEALDGRLTFTRDGQRRVDGVVFASPDGTQRLRRVEITEMAPEELGAYVGTYYSPELDVVYRIRMEGDVLYVARPRQPAQALMVLDRDRFGASTWGLNTVEFSRDDDGRVDGFRVSGGRVRNLRFERVQEWAF
jgi:CubicO group peptidase (beta-lactamase class C family)